MSLWKIEPVAAPDDPRWLDHRVWREIVVRADTVGEALRLAVAMDKRQMRDVDTVGNESQALTSGLSDEKLYGVTPLNTETDGRGFNPDGPSDVLAAERD
ncbi:MAG: hypothetical protein JJ900_09890 [Rhodospirillales bacterium]|nr:hypothetical protein [Rhodospirillales bacterium]MBO6787150.1 hypothetical protein [Rhodospirillales bacterium]